MTQPTISTFAKWMALTAALLGWLFDGLEMGLFPLVAGPALADLLHQDYGTAPTDQQISAWLGIITALFLVGAATGGVLFGWLGDRFGRVKAMMLSVLTYALVSGLCGFATSAWQVGALRFVASLGMGGEWSLGVALITEIWPDSSRAFLAGLMGAAGNLGYLLIAVIGLGLAGFLDETRGLLQTLGVSEDFAKRLLDNSGWRFLMMLGAAPALLTFFIRIFVPESSRWQHEREKGATSHWNSHDLWGVLIGGLGAIGIILLWTPEFPRWLQALGIGENDASTPAIARVAGSLLGFGIALWGYTDPVRKFLGRAESDALPLYHRSGPTFRRMLLGACLSGVALLGTWGSVQQAPPYARKLMIANETAAWRQANTAAKEVPTEAESKIKGHAQVAASYTQAASALGAVAGTLVAAWLANRFGRRITYFALCVGSLAIIPAFYLTRSTVDAMFYVFAFAMGAITASFYGWLPLYLPEIFRTAVRATGQGFGFNFGRILAAVGVLQLGNLTTIFHGGLPIACTVLSAVYLIGMAIIWLAPETKGQPLPE
jgi:SHS family sialic acid transporter-like MFS transporter